MANNFLAFCPTDTGTNLLTQVEYAAATDRTSGNKPGVASAKLNNRAIRQSAYVVSQIDQYLANKTGTDLLDDGITAKLLAQISATLMTFPPKVTEYLSGSGNHNITYIFFIATGSATAAATYTNNSVTFTVVETVASGLYLRASGNGAPAVNGTLTKATGTGDATLTFYAVRAPIAIQVDLQAGGGGGGGQGGNGTAGNDSTVGSSFLTATAGAGGLGAGGGGAAGSGSIAAGATGEVFSGAAGSPACGSTANTSGGKGGEGGLGSGAGTGALGGSGNNGGNAGANSGAGGGGVAPSGASGGGGGGGGGGLRAWITASLASVYAYAVGAAVAGGGGTSSGGTSGAGRAQFIEYYN